MSLDTKYRPRTYADVLGQEGTVQILRSYVTKKQGFQQSYLFGGAWGSGKTTLGRILARALLCENPSEGNPCDACDSCESILETGASECLIEVDAATNSGKADIAKIVEDIQYGTFSGKRKIYIFDECFTEDTMLITPEGARSIKDLVEQRYEGLVFSCNPETGTTCWQPVTNWYALEEDRECLTLEFDNGTLLTVTVDQEIFTKNRGWVAASALTEDDDICETRIASLASEEMARLIRSTSVGKKKVYDVTVAETHSFFAYSRNGRQDHAILAHNCHEMSKSAMDSLLLPLEDPIPGSNDKKLVCIFCTTEPEKMRPAILSRCAPAFMIRPASPEQIADRLAQIAQTEGLEYDHDALVLIAEVTECHIRDALKAVEGVGMAGRLDRPSVLTYLHMDANGLYVDVLEALGQDLKQAMEAAQKALLQVSPSTLYRSLSDLAILAYKVGCLETGNVPSYLDRDRLVAIGQLHRDFLIEIASRLSKSPSRPTPSMLVCDISTLHLLRTGAVSAVLRTEIPIAGSATPASVVSSEESKSTEDPPKSDPSHEGQVPPPESTGKVDRKSYTTSTGVYIDERALRSRKSGAGNGGLPPILPEQFSFFVDRRLQELAEEHGGSAGRDYLGGA